MIESGSNRFDCKFVHDYDSAVKRNSDPRHRGCMIFSDSLSIAFQAKNTLKLNQSWAVGFSILELSKYVMQSLMYEVIMPVFKNRVSVLLSDTDSWVLSVPAKSPEHALYKIRMVMDFSNYPPSHPLYSVRAKNKTGYLKNELPNEPIEEVVGIRSKCYAIRTKKCLETRCKGVKKAAKNRFTFDTFKNCINQISQIEVNQVSIQAKSHLNRLVACRKVAFSSFDDKRHLLCAVHSVPYGSKLIKVSQKLKRCYFCAFPRKMS